MKRTLILVFALIFVQTLFAQVVALKTLVYETDFDTETGGLKEGAGGENGYVMNLWFSNYFLTYPETNCLNEGDVCGELEINIREIDKVKKLKEKSLEDMVLYIKVSSFNSPEVLNEMKTLYENLKGLNISVLAFITEAENLYEYVDGKPTKLNQTLLDKINQTWGKDMLQITSQVYVWEYFR